MSKVRTRLLWLAAGLGLFSACNEKSEVAPPPPPPPPNLGHFVGQVKASFGDDGRTMTLLENFGYVDPRDKLWVAPHDTLIDGASIPRAFWTFMGGPFEGKYRNASVVHDFECESMREPWEAVHKMFYEACLCGGVEPWQAKVMYAAVYKFGPRWQLKTVMASRVGPDGKTELTERKVPEIMAAPAPPSDERVRALEAYVRRTNPSLKEIEELDIYKLPDAPAQ